MTVESLMNLFSEYPYDTIIEIFNPGYEWYGLDQIPPEAWKYIDGRLVLSFGLGKWSDHEVTDYRAKRAEMEKTDP